jgi:hypothetical protein
MPLQIARDLAALELEQLALPQRAQLIMSPTVPKGHKALPHVAAPLGKVVGAQTS